MLSFSPFLDFTISHVVLLGFVGFHMNLRFLRGLRSESAQRKGLRLSGQSIPEFTFAIVQLPISLLPADLHSSSETAQGHFHIVPLESKGCGCALTCCCVYLFAL